MKPGFYTIMAAQFFSSLADNALLIAAIALLRELHEPAWMTPALKQCFVVSYVVLAPLVGAFADSMPKGRVMLITNGSRSSAASLMLFTLHPLAAYAVVGLRRRRVFAGQVRHPDRAPAAAAARRRQRLDRGHDRRLDHPRRAARRRADQPEVVDGAARLRHAAASTRGIDTPPEAAIAVIMVLLRRSPRSSTGSSPTPASTTACRARIRSS